MAAAFLLPMVATLVLAGLAPEVAAPGVLAAAANGQALQLAALPTPDRALGVEASDVSKAAYLVGDPLVGPGQAWAPHGLPPLAGHEMVNLSSQPPLVPPATYLVHPTELVNPMAVAATYAARPVGGAQPGPYVPARGADAFEVATITQLQAASGVLLVGSVPAVALVAIVFAAQEARSHQGIAVALAAAGGHRQARWVLVGRIALMVAIAVAAAVAVTLLLWRYGGASFHGTGLPRRRLLAALAPPAAAALACGLFVGVASPSALRLLRSPPGDVPERLRLPLPLLARPLLLGVRLVPVLLVAGLLFAVDVGFPIAAAGVPAALGGAPGEWIIGAGHGIQAGHGVPDAVAGVAGFDSRIDAIVAESVAATLIDGAPMVVRGGQWSALAAYHGLALEGAGPQPLTIALGAGAAARLGVGVGDRVAVQGSDRPFIAILAVSGLVHGPQLLEDEAFVDVETGRALAGIPAGHSTLIRFRPETQAAADAVAQGAPNLQVTGLEIFPDDPASGSLAVASIRVANLGAEPGIRPITLRVNGAAVGQTNVTLAGHETTKVTMPFIVPSGALHVEVNPSTNITATAGERLASLGSTPQGHIVLLTNGDGQPLAGRTVTIHRGLDDAAARRAPIVTATTNAGGQVSLALEAGPHVARSNDTYLSFLVLAGPGRVAASRAWLVPAAPTPGEAVQAFVEVQNLGLEPATGTVNVTSRGGIIQFAEVTLQPGETRTVSLPVRVDEGISSLVVGGLVVDLGSHRPPGAPGPTAVVGILPVPGGAAQTQVAVRALGEARGALVALGAVALLSSLTAISLATQRSLQSRRHVAGVWRALGRSDDDIRARAAWEAGILGGICMMVMLVPAKAMFLAVGNGGAALAFGHSLPDPVTPLFALQATAAFVAACALTGYLASARAVARLR